MGTNPYFGESLDLLDLRDRLRMLVNDVNRYRVRTQVSGRSFDAVAGRKQVFGRPFDMVARRKQAFGLPFDMVAGRKQGPGLERDILQVLQELKSRLDIVNQKMGLPNDGLGLRAALRDLFTRARLDDVDRKSIEEAVAEQLDFAYSAPRDPSKSK